MSLEYILMVPHDQVHVDDHSLQMILEGCVDVNKSSIGPAAVC